jgi:MazG family protein
MEEPEVDREASSVDALRRLIERLRGENGCPWDRKQTPSSIMVYLIEEVYELMEAVENGPPDAVCEELGDVLFHILFIAAMYKEGGHFDFRTAVHRNTEKMIRRHPHVFGGPKMETAEAVRVQWHQIKGEEKKREEQASVLDSVPKTTPALVRAYRVSERAAATGFDWQDIGSVLEKVDEELSEFKAAVSGNDAEKIALEFGDILFTLTNVARFAKIHPEPALARSINKFIKRFRHMEEAVAKEGKVLESVAQPEKEKYWEKAKEEF